MIVIHPYHRNSRSVQALIEAFEQHGIRAKVRVKTAPPGGTWIINWGLRQPHLYRQPEDRSLNYPGYLHNMTDKLRFFRRVGRDCVLVPEWTSNRAEAIGWDDVVVARFQTGASGGAGISIWEPNGNDPFPEGAPLYTRYRKKTHEFRLHMFRSPETGTFDIRDSQRKVRREGVEPTTWRVRNLANGFVFKRNGVDLPEEVIRVAKELMSSYFSGIDFCALDVIYHEPTSRAFVLEGNTAPGLEGQTVETYTTYFIERCT
jgi:hypothetical protein